MGEQLFRNGIRIVDDPLRRRGLRSRPFDGEGVAGRTLAVIEDGVLKSWFLVGDGAGYRLTTAIARGVSSSSLRRPTSISKRDRDRETVSDIADGFHITDLIGMGTNRHRRLQPWASAVDRERPTHVSGERGHHPPATSTVRVARTGERSRIPLRYQRRPCAWKADRCGHLSRRYAHRSGRLTAVVRGQTRCSEYLRQNTNPGPSTASPVPKPISRSTCCCAGGCRLIGCRLAFGKSERPRNSVDRGCGSSIRSMARALCQRPPDWAISVAGRERPPARGRDLRADGDGLYLSLANEARRAGACPANGSDTLAGARAGPKPMLAELAKSQQASFSGRKCIRWRCVWRASPMAASTSRSPRGQPAGTLRQPISSCTRPAALAALEGKRTCTIARRAPRRTGRCRTGAASAPDRDHARMAVAGVFDSLADIVACMLKASAIGRQARDRASCLRRGTTSCAYQSHPARACPTSRVRPQPHHIVALWPASIS